MAVDKVKWHVGAEGFPAGLPRRNGGTHTGMFVDWALRRGLTSEKLDSFSAIGAWLLRRGLISGRTFIVWFCDETFSSAEHLNSTGRGFADAYFDRYLEDYESLFGGRYKTVYHVPYSAANKLRVANLLDERYRRWQTGLSSAG